MTIHLAKKFRAERDEAHRTKAEISDKKTASALGRLSAAVRQNHGIERELTAKRAEIIELKSRLGEAEDWKTATGWKAILPELRSLHDTQLGKRLKDTSNEMGLAHRSMPDAKWGQVGVYHRIAVEQLLRLIKERAD